LTGQRTKAAKEYKYFFLRPAKSIEHLTEKAEIKESPGFFSCTAMPGEKYEPVMALQPEKRRFSN
jgi:hypothetical protein